MKIQDICLNIGKSGCLCFCDLFLIGIDSIELIKNYNRLVDRGIIDKDCFINNHNELLRFFGAKDKEYIIVEGLEPVDRPYIANYIYKNKNHYVVEKNGKIIFNSLDDSNCVKYGRKENKYRYLK